MNAEDAAKVARMREGFCPDCGYSRCMTDGKTGLWCPRCDASYFLDDRPVWERDDACTSPGRRAVVIVQGEAKE